jgi:putative aldouronate transport system permease protein
MPGKRNETIFQKLWTQKLWILMTVPFVIHVLVFRYIPLAGWIMAFQDITAQNMSTPIWEQPVIGFKNFISIFTDPSFYMTIRNTLAMAVINLILGTLSAILVALMINETKKGLFKRAVQTISYLPYFISWVVAANLVLEFLSPSGILNNVLVGLGIFQRAELFMGKPELIWWIIGFSYVWKSCGFGAILYLAAMTGIDPQLYEAADMDGAGRLRRIWHITLPGIKPTAVILLIMNVGQLLRGGFDAQWLLKNGLNQDYIEVFGLYVLRYATQMFRYSYAAAAGIFESTVSIILIITANTIAKRMGEESLF